MSHYYSFYHAKAMNFLETLSRHYVACRDSVTKILKIFLIKINPDSILTQSGEVRIDEHIWFPLEQAIFWQNNNFL